jgi:hypothetical protein
MAVQLPPNSTGTIVDTVAGSVGDRQVVSVGDGAVPARLLVVSADGSISTAFEETTTANISAASGVAQLSIGAFSSAALAANSSVQIACKGKGVVAFAISGNAGANFLTWEGSVDGGVNWIPLIALPPGEYWGDRGTTAAIYAARVNASGLSHVRVRSTTVAWAGGAATVVMRAQNNNNMVTVAEGVEVQQKENVNRTLVSLYADRVAGVTTEAMMTMSLNTGGTVTGPGAGFGIPAGSPFRVSAFYVEVLNTTTVVNRVIARLRWSLTSGALGVTSVPVAMVSASAPAALAAASGWGAVEFPDGLELPGGSFFGVSFLASVTTAAIVSAHVVGYQYAA